MKSKTPKMSQVLALLVVLGLFMTACGGSDTLNLTFDGESCTYEGPTELKAGPVTIDLVNESDEVFRVELMRHTGDETIQDMIDWYGPEPSTKPPPTWVQHLDIWEYPVFTEEDPGSVGWTVSWQGNLEPGIHTMVCTTLRDYRAFFGTGLIVEE